MATADPKTVKYNNTIDLLGPLQSTPLPDPSRSIKVIGAGLSRTATVSFTLALAKLLDGPVCHTGSASLLREEDFIKKWLKVMDPKTVEASKEKLLREMLKGYVGITDSPAYQFVGELVNAFPDAIVICTTRDQDRWWTSFSEMMKTVSPWWVPVVFWSLPTLRWFGKWYEGMDKRRHVIYPGEAELCAELLSVHHEYVKRVTPPEKLFFFDVKQGWEPLCKILDVPVPDEPFPHANDANAIQAAFVTLLKRAAFRWLQWIAMAGVVIAAVVYALK